MSAAAAVTVEHIKALRERTGAGMADCKQALVETGGDVEKAVDLLREKGKAGAAKRAGREASEGLVDSYIHPGGQVGVLLELSSETDFVARTPAFQALAHELCLQVAAASPEYVNRDDVPGDDVERELAVYRSQALAEGKKPEFVEKIIAGRLEKFYKERVLLDQVHIKGEKGQRTVGDLVREQAALMGENIQVRRFARFRVGEG